MKISCALALTGVILGTVLAGADGSRSCWFGGEGYLNIMDCAGSCAKARFRGGMWYGCWYREVDDGCRPVYGVTTCFCKKPLCNTPTVKFPNSKNTLYKVLKD